MEGILGRPLKRTEIVHHIDGNKSNNERANLELTSHEEHNLGHLGKRIAIECGFCGAPLSVWPYKLRRNKSGLAFCNNHCSGKYYYGQGVKGRPFTPDEDDKIRRLRESGLSFGKIGKELTRNPGSIRVRAISLGIHTVKGG